MKPDDIPQDVWDAALRLWQDEEFDPGEVIVARAIMAATLAEREACAKAAEEKRVAWCSAEYFGGFNDACNASASAIRNRSNT